MTDLRAELAASVFGTEYTTKDNEAIYGVPALLYDRLLAALDQRTKIEVEFATAYQDQIAQFRAQLAEAVSRETTLRDSNTILRSTNQTLVSQRDALREALRACAYTLWEDWDEPGKMASKAEVDALLANLPQAARQRDEQLKQQGAAEFLATMTRHVCEVPSVERIAAAFHHLRTGRCDRGRDGKHNGVCGHPFYVTDLGWPAALRAALLASPVAPEENHE